MHARLRMAWLRMWGILVMLLIFLYVYAFWKCGKCEMCVEKPGLLATTAVVAECVWRHQRSYIQYMQAASGSSCRL